jgi:hypothetical protein
MSTQIALPAGIPTFDERRAMDEALAARYFLVRIGGNAGYDLMRCKRCNGKHQYLTLMCEPQPFSGATKGIFAWFHALGLPGKEFEMSPEDRKRFADLARLFKLGRHDIGASHPRMAAAMKTEQNAVDIGAFPLGTLEQIPPTLAQRLLDKINATGLKPPLVVPGLFTDGRLGVLTPLLGGQHA